MTKSRRGIAGITVAVAMTIAVFTSACIPNISWKSGATHGIAIETGAARGGLNIYRYPRLALYNVLRATDINTVQDAMWQFGQPPRFSICVQGYCITQAVVASKIHGWIYGDDGDLRGALLAAQENYNCLSLTLISRGVYNKNWTHKNVGCYLGDKDLGMSGTRTTDYTVLPSGEVTVRGEAPLAPNGSTDPVDPTDYVPTGPS